MKSFLVLSIFCTVFCISCQHKEKQSQVPITRTAEVASVKELETGKIIENVSYSKDPSLSYALYLPSSYSKGKNYPIIYFFDAHARGKMPLKLYSKIAEKHGFILVGSNNSKNGTDAQLTDRIVDELLRDAREKLSIDTNLMYTGGFSGGAKVASVTALKHPEISGVIACAAGMPFDVKKIPIRFDFIGLVGLEDFNYSEMKTTDESLKNAHKLIVHKGKHDWPDKNNMDIAFHWIQLQAMEKGTLKKDDLSIKETAKLFQDSIVNDNYTPSQLKREIQIQQQYIEAFREKEQNWWKQETHNLNLRAKGTTTESYMNKRLLNHISMGCYMYATSTLKQQQVKQTEHFLSIYEMVDPENPDLYYFKACLFVLQDQKAEAINALKQAVDLGFSNVEKLEKDNLLNALHKEAEFDEIVNQALLNSDK